MVEMDSSLHEMDSDELRGKSVALDGRGRNDGVSSEGDVSDEDERRLRVYEQLLGILYTHRLWKLRAQSKPSKYVTIRNISIHLEYFFADSFCHCHLFIYLHLQVRNTTI